MIKSYGQLESWFLTLYLWVQGCRMMVVRGSGPRKYVHVQKDTHISQANIRGDFHAWLGKYNDTLFYLDSLQSSPAKASLCSSIHFLLSLPAFLTEFPFCIYLCTQHCYCVFTFCFCPLLKPSLLSLFWRFFVFLI